MKKFIALALAIGVLGILGFPSAKDACAESYGEYIKKLRKAERPELIPKGGLRPKRLRVKDIVIETTKQCGELNTSEALLFEYGLPVLRPIPENEDNLEVIAEGIKIGYEQFPDYKYYIDGHTCDIGTNENNCRLSWERARAIYNKLIEKGVKADRLVVRGFGEIDPAHPNTSEANRKLNRRVVILTAGCDQAKDKDHLACGESGGSLYSQATSPSGRVSPGPSGGGGEALSGDVDWDTLEQLEKAAKENRAEAEKAAADGDQTKASYLKAAADKLDEVAFQVKGLRAKSKPRSGGMLPGFKPAGGKGLPTKEERGPLPGFKPVRK